MQGAQLDVLLVEDNPGDARLIEEMLREAEGLLERVDVGDAAIDGSTVHHEETLEAGLDHLAAADVDVVLLDLGLPDSTGLDTLAAVVEATEFVPVVVLTGLRDEAVGVEAVQRGGQDYLVKDEVTSELLVRSIHHAIERNQQQRARARQLRELESLNRLNQINQEITHDVITTSTREELEQAVCDRLVESDAYRFAWIGEVDRASGRVVPRRSAGAEDGYLEEVEVTADDDETGQGTAGRAVRTAEVQVVQDIETDSAYDPWREPALERGFRSGASVPIAHDDFLYGVLNVYAGTADAFSEAETEILGRLGDVIGHAITSIERKDALVTDSVVEMEFRTGAVAQEFVGLTRDGEAHIDIENLVRSDGAHIAYGRATGMSEEAVREAAERSAAVDDFRVLSEDGHGCRFEIVTGILSSLADAVATHGGNVTSAAIADGEVRFVVAYPPGRDKRQLAEIVTEHCDGATHYAQRLVERDDEELTDTASVLQQQLTEKQRTALEVAYLGGYFEWPRTSTGQEIADRLGISPATLTQHLRTAERKFFDAVFDGGRAGEEAGTSTWSSKPDDA